MDQRKFDWRSIESSEEKRAEWHRRAREKIPHRTWYFCSEVDTESPAMLEELKLVFWNPQKGRVALDVDVKRDVIADCPTSSFLRITMPERFVPHFTTEGKTFVLYRATVGETLVDFGRLWDGVVPIEIRLGASTHTIMGDLSRAVDKHDAPPPSGLLRAAESRHVHSAEVVHIPLHQVASVKRHIDLRKDPTEIPVNDTLCPVPEEETASECECPPEHSARSAWAVFGGDDPESELEPPVQLPPPRRPAPIPAMDKVTLSEDRPDNTPAGCLMLAVIITFLIIFSFLVIF